MARSQELLSVVDTDPQHTAALVPDLERALDGTGPTIAPLSSTTPDRDRVRAALRPDEPLELPGIAVVLPTSGSTGAPKGVLLSRDALMSSASATIDRIGGPGRWLLALPPTRIAGLQVLVRSLLAGTSPVTLPEFDPPSFIAATAQLSLSYEGRRYTALVPTQLERLLDAGSQAVDALTSYDAILLGGAAARGTLLRRARTAGVRIVPTYGMTETCGGCVYDGTPLDGVRVSLEPDGRIRIGGAVVFSGYRCDPDATAEALVDGWHRTADLGRIDDEGRLAVLGRLDDVVVSGGVNVPLPAVEDAVSALPAVAACAVVGVPDDVWGARVTAFIVVRAGYEAPSLQAVRDHVGTWYPREYAPRKVIVVSELPMLESGKIDRAALSRSL